MSTVSVESAATSLSAQEPQVFVAPQWKLVWWKFRKHRVAVVSAVVVILVYLASIVVEFLAPWAPDAINATYLYAPPQPLQMDRSGLYVHGYISEVDEAALRRTFVVDPTQKIPVGLFVKGVPYKLWGLIPGDVHLIGPLDPSQPMYLLGADRLGRDLLSRLIFGTRISMSVGLLGVLLTFVLGIILGGLSGYYGGTPDLLMQRLMEFVRSIPAIPLWLALAAALPKDMPPLQVYFYITLILSLVNWTDLARVVRGRFLSLREEDFVMAARLDGAGQWRIILRHMVPAFASHIIASITLAIPNMILSETALSFLGLGLRDPVVSWGVLLQDAQDVRTIATAPWLLVPALALVVTVLAMNFFGDGLRDAADPYAR